MMKKTFLVLGIGSLVVGCAETQKTSGYDGRDISPSNSTYEVSDARRQNYDAGRPEAYLSNTDGGRREANPSAASASSAQETQAIPFPSDREQIEADNTRINTRDRGDSVTPMDQGNSARELEITAQIRRSIMNDKDLSFAAKNIKVVTTGGKVTLRGPVSSALEKGSIGNLAMQTAGVTEVDNQIEIQR